MESIYYVYSNTCITIKIVRIIIVMYFSNMEPE